VVGLARVKRIAPTLTVQAATHCDVSTLQALVVHRYEALAQYASALRASCTAEMHALKERGVVVSARAIERWLHVETSALPEDEHRQLARAIEVSPVLATVYAMRDELAGLWQRSAAPKEQLVHRLEDWCRRADASGIQALRDFSLKLRGYRSVPCA
jgi:stearoyl-CoA desaturase (delta-9 desaturase)